MATPRKPRKRPARKRTQQKQQNSNIASAQRAASERRLERVKKAAETGKPQPSGAAPGRVDPRTGLPVPQPPGAASPGDPVGRGATLAAQGKSDGKKKDAGAPAAVGLSAAANKIAGLAQPLMQKAQQERRALADTSLYGKKDADRAKTLADLMTAQDQARRTALNKTGSAVYMGAKIQNAKLRNRGPERIGEDGSTTTSVGPVGDDIRSKDELMSWLADEGTFNEIRKKANEAGIAVESYDDVAKLWTSVVNQAAATYSSTGKKVTPWALLSLRGKTMKNGKPASKTTVSTSIDEMDPAEAKGMIRNAASQLLGRDPTSEEIEDFIAKAQTIAKANPEITKVVSQYGFDGEVSTQQRFVTGGQDAVTAQAQEAALAELKQSEDYASYQAAGVYMPWLMDALASPI